MASLFKVSNANTYTASASARETMLPPPPGRGCSDSGIVLKNPRIVGGAGEQTHDWQHLPPVVPLATAPALRDDDTDATRQFVRTDLPLLPELTTPTVREPEPIPGRFWFELLGVGVAGLCISFSVGLYTYSVFAPQLQLPMPTLQAPGTASAAPGDTLTSADRARWPSIVSMPPETDQSLSVMMMELAAAYEALPFDDGDLEASPDEDAKLTSDEPSTRSPDPRRWSKALTRGERQMGEQQYLHAVWSFRRAAQYNPRDARTLVRLGDALRKASALRAAERAYLKALTLAPDDTGARIALEQLESAGVTGNSVLEASP